MVKFGIVNCVNPVEDNPILPDVRALRFNVARFIPVNDTVDAVVSDVTSIAAALNDKPVPLIVVNADKLMDCDAEKPLFDSVVMLVREGSVMFLADIPIEKQSIFTRFGIAKAKLGLEFELPMPIVPPAFSRLFNVRLSRFGQPITENCS